MCNYLLDFIGFNAHKPLEKQLLPEDYYDSKMKDKYNLYILQSKKKFESSHFPFVDYCASGEFQCIQLVMFDQSSSSIFCSAGYWLFSCEPMTCFPSR